MTKGQAPRRWISHRSQAWSEQHASAVSFFRRANVYLQEWGLDVTKSSILSGLPWALSFALANVSGFVADNLINNNKLTITQTRKLVQGIASLGPAACLTVLSLQPSGPGRLLLLPVTDVHVCNLGIWLYQHCSLVFQNSMRLTSGLQSLIVCIITDFGSQPITYAIRLAKLCKNASELMQYRETACLPACMPACLPISVLAANGVL